MQFHSISNEQVLDYTKSTMRGLSPQEVANRRAQHGLNTIRVKGTPWWQAVLEPFRDIFMIVLLGAVAISFWQGEYLDGGIILVIIAISAIILYVQRFSTSRVLASLNAKSVERVTVVRNGKPIAILATQLVPGDIIRLSEGEKVPADIRLIDSTNLRADESVLTGESLPIAKHSDMLGAETPTYEQTNMLFSGAFIVGGTGTGVVVAIANETQFGRIATLSEHTESKSPMQRKIDALILKITIIIGAVAVVAFGLALARGIEFGESLRFVIALSVSAVPEGLPIAISVVLVLGMRRMAAKKALVRQMRAIETLGMITVIATDKTGTLTENRLSVHETWTVAKTGAIDEVIARAINFSSDLRDPLDQALVTYAAKAGTLSEKARPAYELPFEQTHAMSAAVWHHGTRRIAYIKGAPEVVLSHATLSAPEKKAAEAELRKLTAKGYRVIALASTDVVPADEPTAEELLGAPWTLHGFVAIADTLREEAHEAIASALAAGVSVRMITGDHAETAYQIGRQLGLAEKREQVLDCREIEHMSEQELAKAVRRTKIFARVVPEQKYRLLTALKKSHITAMTGDGVNDVPALANAHIGVAMGSGSHIAKDAADIVLLDDNFKTILDAMREGRVIVSNVRRMLVYLLATNAGEVLVMLGALIFGTRLPLEAVQILWVNLVTDTALVIPLGLEPAEDDVMKHKPAKPRAPLLDRTMIIRMVLIALVVGALTLTTYLLFLPLGHAYAQTMAFVALIASQWGNAFAVRSHHRSTWSRLKVINPSFIVGICISIILQALVFFGPLGSVLHVTPVDTSWLLIVSIASFLLPIIVSDVHKGVAGRGQSN